MSDKWEVVGTGKPKKPRAANGQVNTGAPKPISVIPGNNPTKPAKRKKHIGPRDSKIAKLPGSDDEEVDENEFKAKVETASLNQLKPSKKPLKQPAEKPKDAKPKDLATALKNVSPEQMRSFYRQLTTAGSVGDVFLSWIKYSADALNSQLSRIPTPDGNQWPNNLNFPVIPKGLEVVIQSIITQTAASQEDVDVIGLSFSSLLALIPTLVMRGDAGWGQLLFLREMCKIDSDVWCRRSKTFTDLMESYGNRKDVGTCLLWVAAQASLYSDNVLKIMTEHILPYYNFKHYKSFVLSVLSALGSAPVMVSDNVIEAGDFEAFFELSFDPKKRRDFEEFYPKIRNLALRNLRDHGEELFFKFLLKLGDKSFMPLSAYGQEVFEVLHGCLGNDSSMIEKWRIAFQKHLKESTLLLNHLAKHPESVKYFKKLESALIQTDEFARAAVESPDLIRIAKKLQTGVKRVEATRKGFPWKMSCFLILVIIGGIFYLDVTENGKGTFAKSQTGEFLERNGLLPKAQAVIDTTRNIALKIWDLVSKLIRALYEGVRPLLQAVEKQANTYIPEVLNSVSTLGNYLYEKCLSLIKFMQDNIFIGPLSPSNVRKLVKDSLTLIWTAISTLLTKLYEQISKYLGQ